MTTCSIAAEDHRPAVQRRTSVDSRGTIGSTMATASIPLTVMGIARPFERRADDQPGHRADRTEQQRPVGAPGANVACTLSLSVDEAGNLTEQRGGERDDLVHHPASTHQQREPRLPTAFGTKESVTS
jgi:hypothetical protein